MPYITREDGEHFVVPSYRDVLSVGQKSLLKKEMILLSRSYGEYVTLQKKTPTQYEVAFSPDTGYLLGESIWHYFKKPLDMVYCEAIPNTTEAILVIVKAGSVYLDGSFPVESIPEELIIFLTQQNNFEIYIYGDVPISKEPEAGKFSFEPNSVKSYTILDQPIFPTLPLLKIYQLQLVDQVLKSQGIGVFPTKPLIMVAGIVAVLFGGYYFFLKPPAVTEQAVTTPEINPYLAYNNELNSPAPDEEISNFVSSMQTLYSLPGWRVSQVKYIHSTINATMLSTGARIQELYSWSQDNRANVQIRSTGILLTMFIDTPKRPIPTVIYSVPRVISKLTDNLASIYPGNRLDLGNFVTTGLITKVLVTIRLQNVSFLVLDLIGQQTKGLPMVLRDITATPANDGSLNGSITLEILGN